MMEEVKLFLERIGMDPDMKIELTVDLLSQVQQHCVTHIAYENLDILAGKSLQLDWDSIFDKIVRQKRGGYCFELNGLLTDMLRLMGFHATERFARFLLGEREAPMRRHRVTVVHLPDGDYLMDIGVGIIAPRQPLKLEKDTVQQMNGESYRFTRDLRHGWVLWQLRGRIWHQYICFNDDMAYPVDFVQPSFYCEKHPDSPFNKDYMLSIKTEKGRRTIDGRCYKEFEGEELVCIEEDLSEETLKERMRSVFFLNV